MLSGSESWPASPTSAEEKKPFFSTAVLLRYRGQNASSWSISTVCRMPMRAYPDTPVGVGLRKSYWKYAYLRRTNQPAYPLPLAPCLMSVVTRTLARSPAGILNVRYARSMSNLLVAFPSFAALVAESVWTSKLPKTTPEKSSEGVFTCAGGGWGGWGGALVVLSWPCADPRAAHTSRASALARMVRVVIMS